MTREISHLDQKLSAEVELILYDLLIAVKKANRAGMGAKIDFGENQTTLTMWRDISTSAFDEDRAKIIKKVNIP